MTEAKKEIDNVTGEHPPNLEEIPADVKIGDFASPRRLEEQAHEHLEKHPEIIEGAMANGQDVIAVSDRMNKLLIGAGVATLLLALSAVGGRVIYKHSHKK